jgi:hypothetical protein
MCPLSLFCKCKKGNAARSLNRLPDIPLMICTISGDPSRNDLSTLRYKVPEQSGVFVIDIIDLIGAKAAVLLPLSKPAFFHLRLLHIA